MVAEEKADAKIKYNGLSSKMGSYLKKMRDDMNTIDQTSKSLNIKRSLRK